MHNSSAVLAMHELLSGCCRLIQMTVADVLHEAYMPACQVSGPLLNLQAASPACCAPNVKIYQNPAVTHLGYNSTLGASNLDALMGCSTDKLHSEPGHVVPSAAAEAAALLAKD
jgi:hypothetical protein